MSFNLFKAIKNTHKHPLNITLHIIGFIAYFLGLSFIILYFDHNISKVITGIFCIITAIGLFLIGHKIEGNMGANSIIILLKYIKYKMNKFNK